MHKSRRPLLHLNSGIISRTSPGPSGGTPARFLSQRQKQIISQSTSKVCGDLTPARSPAILLPFPPWLTGALFAFHRADTICSPSGRHLLYPEATAAAFLLHSSRLLCTTQKWPAVGLLYCRRLSTTPSHTDLSSRSLAGRRCPNLPRRFYRDDLLRHSERRDNDYPTPRYLLPASRHNWHHRCARHLAMDLLPHLQPRKRRLLTCEPRDAVWPCLGRQRR